MCRDGRLGGEVERCQTESKCATTGEGDAGGRGAAAEVNRCKS